MHTHIAEPVDAYLDWSRYDVIFMDNYSRMCKTYTLRYKLEALRALLPVKRDVPKASGLRLQRFRFDQRVFTANKLRTSCTESSIEKVVSAAYIPQQIGVTKQNWRDER